MSETREEKKKANRLTLLNLIDEPDSDFSWKIAHFRYEWEWSPAICNACHSNSEWLNPCDSPSIFPSLHKIEYVNHPVITLITLCIHKIYPFQPVTGPKFAITKRFNFSIDSLHYYCDIRLTATHSFFEITHTIYF